MNDFDSIIKRMTVTRLEPGDYTGEDGLLYCGNIILPFIDRFPKDTELYRIMTTKLQELKEGKQS